MSDSPNNPVMQQPKRMSSTARLGIIAGMALAAMDSGQTNAPGVARGSRRSGKHHGRNPGAFGKQK